MHAGVRSRRAHRRGVAASLAAALLFGCSADPAEDPGSAPSTTTSATPSATPSSSAPIAPSEPSSGGPAARESDCQNPQLRANRGMEYPLTRVFWLMTRDLDGRSAAAALKARVSVERAADLVRESCGRVPTEMASLRKRVRVATAAPLDARGLKAIEASFARWVEAVGAGAASALQGATAGVRACKRLGQQVRAGYALWWDYSSDGKRWWVQMHV